MEGNTTPAWLNKDFFVYALTGNSDRSDCEILSLETTPGIFGDNFASEVFKSRIKFKANRNSYIKHKLFFIKAPVQKGPLVDMVREEFWAEKEQQMYKEYFPLMDRLVGGIDTIPTYFPCKEIRTVVLEDLAGEGYTMCDKYKQLDFEHSASVLKSLARFHAASVAVHKHSPDFVETLGAKIFKETADSITKDKYRHFRKEVVQSWKGFERFSDLCGQYEGKYERITEFLNPLFARRKTLNVLNHGDAWINNVMFKYDEAGKIKKVKLIDFQLPAYGTIGIDLQFFTWTSIQPSVRAHRLSELYGLYLETLNLYLEKFGCEESLNQEQFKEEMEFTLDLVYFSFVCCHCVMLSGKYSNQDIVDEDGKILTTYDDACYRANAEQGLLFLESKGFFSNTR